MTFSVIAATSTFVSTLAGSGAVAVILGAVMREWIPRVLDQRLKERQTEFEASVRGELEERLAEGQAWRAYTFDARRKLYETIGPLRFQLLLANRELAGRVVSYADRPYPMSPGSYYLTSFTYRVIRPLALAELIERQIAYADFSVDEQMVDLLRFKAAAKAMLCDNAVIFDDPDADWLTQREHFFSGKLGELARTMLTDDGDGTLRVLREEEFATQIDQREISKLAYDMLATLDLGQTPRLWARLTGYGYTANWLLARLGSGIGVSPQPYPVVKMISACPVEHISERAEQFPTRLDEIIAQAL